MVRKGPWEGCRPWLEPSPDATLGLDGYPLNSHRTSNALPEIVTAAVLVIGDEILSGRTKDKNIGYIADYLTALGIDLREVRVVPDVEAEIVGAINALRVKYDYLFTTGGIGPT